MALSDRGMKRPVRPSVPQNEQPDDGLVRRIRAGDQEAFRAVYDRCQAPIFRFALHMSGSRTVAEDVTQEVFMALIKDGGSFNAAQGTLSAYLFGVARNHLWRHLEKERLLVPLPEEDLSGARVSRLEGNGSGSANGNGHHPAKTVVSPADFARDEMIGLVRQAVLSLPPNYREVAVLCDLEEMSYSDAAVALDCAVGTVRSRLHRARALLTQKLRSAYGPKEQFPAGANELANSQAPAKADFERRRQTQ